MHIALLRGVNLGGHNAVAMAALRECLSGLGCREVRTLLQSGNIIFDGGQGRGAALERWLEVSVATQLGLATDIFVRTPTEWSALIAANPFREDAERDPAHLLAMCFKSKLTAAAVEALRGAIVGRERIAAVGRELYIVYPDGIGRSRLTTVVIDSKLGMRGTARNWNTVRKLAALTS